MKRGDLDRYHEKRDFEASPEPRGGKVFIDWFRNGRGATAVAAWSTRARPHAPIAAPIAWPELSRLSGADAFRVGRAPRRDPWKGFFDLRQRLPAR